MADREPSSLDVHDVYGDTLGKEPNRSTEGGRVSEGEASAGEWKGQVVGERGLKKLRLEMRAGEGCRGREREANSGRGGWDRLLKINSPPSAVNVNRQTRTKAKESHTPDSAVPCRLEGWLHVQCWQKGHRGKVSRPGGIGVRSARPASLASG